MNQSIDRVQSACGVCGRWERGEWLPSGIRNRRTGETPHDNFICYVCQAGGPENLRVLAEEGEMEARFRATARREVEGWQMPPGKGLSA